MTQTGFIIGRVAPAVLFDKAQGALETQRRHVG
jgi:hypothetical protein